MLQIIYISDIQLRLIWTGREDLNLRHADAGSKKINRSTDEWSINTEDYNQVINAVGVTPTIDCFASQRNKKCDIFFSRYPETGSSGIDFFSQPLSSDNVYLAVPPISAIQKAWRHFLAHKGLTVILLVPKWQSFPYYASFFTNGEFKPCVRKHFSFTAGFVSESEQCLFNGRVKFEMLCLLLKT